MSEERSPTDVTGMARLLLTLLSLDEVSVPGLLCAGGLLKFSM